MFSVELDCSPNEKDLRVAELWEAGCAGITELSDARLRVFFDDEATAARYGAPHPVEERDWVAESRAVWQPIEVGERFFLIPDWIDAPTPPGRYRIAINPGMAFGTGFHASTQLCLEALEREIRPGMTVLDIGTGSGILSVAARLLGARALACDVDLEAVRLVPRQIPAFAGSVDAIRGASADLLVANITGPSNIALAPELVRCLRQGGTAILSGFERDEAAAVQEAFSYNGAALRGVYHKGSWSSLTLCI